MNLEKLMTTAWTIAREAAARFGGRAFQYIGGALKTAWGQARTQKESIMQGSEKQVAWAMDIIKEFKTRVSKNIASINEHINRPIRNERHAARKERNMQHWMDCVGTGKRLLDFDFDQYHAKDVIESQREIELASLKISAQYEKKMIDMLNI